MSNRAENKKVSSGTTMGVTSIIAILVLLVLIVFAALSVTTSKADKNLADNTEASVTNYYEADTKAEEITASIATTVSENPEWKDALKNQKYSLSDKSDGTYVSFSIDIDANRRLDVELLVTSDKKIIKKLWQVNTTGDWNNENGLDVIQEF
jgi:hypothetical protein